MISADYQEHKFLLMQGDFLGAFSYWKERLKYIVNSDYTSREQYDEMVNGLIKELEGNHPQDVPFNIDEVKEFLDKGGSDVKKAREE